tara:strand:+ start:2156 stop:2785 length:630 start_codon:yes stop_codon:yes gene_type:complete
MKKMILLLLVLSLTACDDSRLVVGQFAKDDLLILNRDISFPANEDFIDCYDGGCKDQRSEESNAEWEDRVSSFGAVDSYCRLSYYKRKESSLDSQRVTLKKGSALEVHATGTGFDTKYKFTWVKLWFKHDDQRPEIQNFFMKCSGPYKQTYNSRTDEYTYTHRLFTLQSLKGALGNDFMIRTEIDDDLFGNKDDFVRKLKGGMIAPLSE